jgi:hypothetical protein
MSSEWRAAVCRAWGEEVRPRRGGQGQGKREVLEALKCGRMEGWKDRRVEVSLCMKMLKNFRSKLRVLGVKPKSQGQARQLALTYDRLLKLPFSASPVVPVTSPRSTYDGEVIVIPSDTCSSELRWL